MAELVVCCDGTWNTPDDLEGGLPAPTNVVKLYNALAEKDAKGAEIKRYYHPGVGTDGSWWRRKIAGAAGLGLGENVQSAYRWLAGVYRPGDRIWLFGFSRGAFTARSLSGMISRCGLLDVSTMTDDALWRAVRDVFAAYRAKDGALKATATRPFHNVAAGAATTQSTPIHFIGVWDTVGALGIPDDMALLNLLDRREDYEFHDTDLSAVVVHARHAIAMDERRQSFTPTLWIDTPPRQNLKQMWFPGVHSDVGGGYADSELSDGALQWMIDEAAGNGLPFRKGALAQIRPDPQGVLHDSLTGVFKSLKSRPRKVPLVDKTSSDRVHASALARRKNPPITQSPYWPGSRVKAGKPLTATIYAREKWNATEIYLDAGVAYHFQAKGQWRDASIPCGPEGAADGEFHLAEMAHILFSAVGEAETLFKRFTDNAEADFWYTRREETIGWFTLVGMVASGLRIDDKGAVAGAPVRTGEEKLIAPHETFRIGADRTFTPRASGYLYAFANDAWLKYDNNNGSVQLTVSRP